MCRCKIWGVQGFYIGKEAPEYFTDGEKQTQEAPAFWLKIFNLSVHGFASGSSQVLKLFINKTNHLLFTINKNLNILNGVRFEKFAKFHCGTEFYMNIGLRTI